MPVEVHSAGAQRSVLVVGEIAKFLDRATFQREVGAELVAARCGAEALRLACDRHFDAIVMEIDQGLMSGFEVATRILRSETHRRVRVLFVTHDLASVDGLASISDGQLDGLLKPCSPAVLCGKLRTMLAPQQSGEFRRVS